MKLKKPPKSAPTGIAELTAAVREARNGVRENGSTPESLALLSQALRALAQFRRESDPVGADRLLRLACAAAWESKMRSTPSLISGRTRHEVKLLMAWIRTTQHLSIEDAERALDALRQSHLSEALSSETL